MKAQNSRYFLVIGLILSHFTSLSQTGTSFTANQTEACIYTKITFSVTNPNGVIKHVNWNFGNGTTSNNTSPEIIYSKAGTYDIALIVEYDNQKKDTLIKNNYVHIFGKPEILSVALTDSASCVPLQTQFNPQINSDTAIVFYEWDFGDGETSNARNPEHTYQLAGKFNITLLVKNAVGCYQSKEFKNRVEVFALPQADFWVENPKQCTDTLAAQFKLDTTITGNLPQNYSWDFGNNSYSSQKQPVCTYTGYGKYDVSLKVTTPNGCTAFYKKENYIQLIPLTISTNLPDTICPNETISFTEQGTNADYWEWQFADTALYGQSIQKTFKSAGYHQVKLHTGIKNLCTETISKTIYVEQIIADFVVEKQHLCRLPDTVKYINNSTNATHFAWYLGQRQFSEAENPQIIYNYTDSITKTGTAFYNDTLIATSSRGCSDTLIKPNNIIIRIPLVNFSPTENENNKRQGCTPLVVNFKDNTTYNHPTDYIASRVWDLGDGTNSFKSEFEHTFTNSGVYPVTLTIATANGCQVQKQLIFRCGEKQTPDFQMLTPPVIPASQAAVFEAATSDSSTINGWQWHFSDGFKLEQQQAVYMFTDTGYMNVGLKVGHNGCFSELNTKEKIVYVEGPISKFKVLYDCQNPYNVVFESQLTDADEVYWYFGDGQELANNFGKTIAHQYPKTGDYLVKLRTVNQTTGNEYIYKQFVKIRDLKSIFNASHTVGCVGTEVTLNAENSTDYTAYSTNNRDYLFHWYINDTVPITTNDKQLKYKLTKTGKYNIQLILQDVNGCQDTASRQIRIFKPEIQLHTDKTTGCRPLTIKLDAEIKSDTTVAATNWYVDGTDYSTKAHAAWTSNDIGKHQISFSATDVLGCSDTVMLAQTIQVLGIEPRLAITDPKLCQNDTLKVFSNDTSLVSVKWFVNQTQHTGTAQSFFYLAAEAGTYSLTSIMSDTNGCDTTVVIPEAFSVENYPEANFESDKTAAMCYPVSVHFFNKTQPENLMAYKWHFGDDSPGSTIKNPVYTYNKPGSFSVQMIATTRNGCSDTVVFNKFIEVGGPYAKMNVVQNVICRHTATNFFLSDQKNIHSFLWDLGDGTVVEQDSIEHIYTISGKIPQTLILTTDTLHSCDKILTDTVFIQHVVSDFVLDTTRGCLPLSVTITNRSYRNQHNYWDFGNQQTTTQTAPSLTYEKAGKYTIKHIAQDADGCADTSARAVEVYGLPNILLPNDTTICLGNEIELTASGATSYEWLSNQFTPAGTANKIKVKPTHNCRFWVKGFSEQGCQNQHSVWVKVQHEPVVGLADTTIIIGDYLQIAPKYQHTRQVRWQPELLFDSTHVFAPTIRPLQNVMLCAEATDPHGCFHKSYYMYVTVLEKYALDMPNYFTPNNDGNNDLLLVKGWGLKTLKEFKIFNRNGQLIFSSTDFSIGWDGSFNGKKQPAGSYVYSVVAETFDNQILQKEGVVDIIY